MVGHTLPHIPFLYTLPPLSPTPVHTHSRLSMCVALCVLLLQESNFFLSLSLVSLLAHGVYIYNKALIYIQYIYTYTYA